MDKEKIIFDLPELEGKPQEKELSVIKRKRDIFPKIAAALFALISILLHTAIIAEAFELLKRDGGEFLFSQVIPDYEISEPTTPILPEGSTVEDGRTVEENTDFLIRQSDLSTNAEYGLSLTNETTYNPDLYQLLGRTAPAPTLETINEKHGKDCPKVLIYHTHATEGYADSAGTSFRTNDNNKNVVSVGEVMARVLDKAGIRTLHLTEQFDRENWSAAYDNSNAAVLKVLEQYPSIQYVLDVHRDCIGNDEDGYVRASTEIYKKDVAQLMFVCGTDEGGSGHKEWRSNLTFAVQLQSAIFSEHSSLMRPINLRRASFYQDTRPAALLLECGTCANTLPEAKRSAVIFASALADYISGKDCNISEEEMIGALCP